MSGLDDVRARADAAFADLDRAVTVQKTQQPTKTAEPAKPVDPPKDTLNDPAPVGKAAPTIDLDDSEEIKKLHTDDPNVVKGHYPVTKIDMAKVHQRQNEIRSQLMKEGKLSGSQAQLQARAGALREATHAQQNEAMNQFNKDHPNLDLKNGRLQILISNNVATIAFKPNETE